MWNFVCCPACDYMWTFNAQAGPTAASMAGVASRPELSAGAPAVSAAEPAQLNLSRLFGELDKFCNHILSLPVAAARPEIKQQIDFIIASKEKLKLAQAEALAHRQARRQQLAKMQEAAKQTEDAHRERMEELHTQSPPLDGEALRRALLKNLGFTK